MYKTLLECPWLMGDINSNSESSSAAGDDSKDDMVNFQCVFFSSTIYFDRELLTLLFGVIV